MPLSITDRITILRMRGFGDQIRSYEAVANLFNNIYPEHYPISKSTVYRTVSQFERTGSVEDPDLEDQKLLATTIQH